MFLSPRPDDFVLVDNLTLIISDDDFPLFDAKLPAFNLIPIPASTFLFCDCVVEGCCVEQCRYVRVALLVSAVLGFEC